MRLCDLQDKKVINIRDCKCLGNIVDIEFDEKTGCICTLILPGPGQVFGIFCRDYELYVPWCQVVRIGPDIVLVDVDEKEIKHKL